MKIPIWDLFMDVFSHMTFTAYMHAQTFSLVPYQLRLVCSLPPLGSILTTTIFPPYLTSSQTLWIFKRCKDLWLESCWSYCFCITMLCPNSSRTISRMLLSRTSGKPGRTCRFGDHCISSINVEVLATRNQLWFLTWQMVFLDIATAGYRVKASSTFRSRLWFWSSQTWLICVLQLWTQIFHSSLSWPPHLLCNKSFAWTWSGSFAILCESGGTGTSKQGCTWRPLVQLARRPGRSMIICWNWLSIFYFFFFFCRRLEDCLLTAVIPPGISLLSKMEYL
jgi:hypothetical protein